MARNFAQIMLWQSVGMKDFMPLLLYAVYLSWASILNVVSSLIVDRVGRVRLLLTGIVSSSHRLKSERASLTTKPKKK